MIRGLACAWRARLGSAPKSALDLRELASLMVPAAVDPNWLVAKDWLESSRYEEKTAAQAQDLYNAVADPKTA